MDRRAWLAGLLGLAGAPAVVAAQAPAKAFRIGILAGSTPTSAESRHVWHPFFHALRDLGYVEGQNVVVEGRYYGDTIERLPAFAAELAGLPVDVILAAAPPAPEEARRATSTIPIVMANHSDPVGSGLAASLARPGGNVTGLSMLSSSSFSYSRKLCRGSRGSHSSGCRPSHSTCRGSKPRHGR